MRLSVDRDVTERVDRAIVQADFVMAMWRGRTSGAAHGSDDLAAGHVLSYLHGELRHVAVAGRDSVAVVDHYNVAVTAVHTGEDYSSVSRGLDCGAMIGGDVQARVGLIAASAERIAAAPETVSDVPAHRPAARSRGEFDLIPVEDILDLPQLALQRGGSIFKVAYLRFAIRASTPDLLAYICGPADSGSFGQFTLGRIERGKTIMQLIVLAIRFLVLFL